MSSINPSTISRPDKDKYDHFCWKIIHWSPIILGALIALGLGFLLDVFGKGIGLSLYTTNVEGATALAIGGFLGMMIGSIAAMFTAGFAAGFFSGPYSRKNYGIVYGFAAWCLALLLLAGFTAGLSDVGNKLSNQTITSSREVATTTRNVTSRLHPATDASDTITEKQVRSVGMLTFSVFVLFFIGAFSACIGGYFGFQCWDNCNRDIDTYK